MITMIIIKTIISTNNIINMNIMLIMMMIMIFIYMNLIICYGRYSNIIFMYFTIIYIII